VSEEHEVKTRRKWRPNVHHKNLWSESLGIMVRTRVTTRVLRTIDKAGGLDAYLLGIKPQRVKDLGPWGWRLRWRIMQTPSVRGKFAREREELGLPPKDQEGGYVKLEAGEMLPDGTVAGDALLAETDRMLADKAEFELGAEDGFMQEENPGRQ
jgi:large subunit ribosomal protein L28